MQMILYEADILAAIRDYLKNRGLQMSTATVDGAWTKGMTRVICDVSEASREWPIARPATPALQGAAEEAGARALYDLVLRFYGENFASKPWEELPVDVKKEWLKEANRLATARAGRDSG